MSAGPAGRAGAGLPGGRVAGVIFALLATAAITLASRVPLTAHASSGAMLRLSWTARPERIEQCRTVGEEELAALPAHMRQQVVCEGVTARYRVDVLRNGQLLASDLLRGGGLRNDRQLYHHREIAVPSGPARIEVRVTRTHPAVGAGHDDDDRDGDEGDREERDDDSHDGDRAARDDEGRRRRRAEAIPASLVLTERVTLAPGEVMLVLYDRTARRMRAVRRDLK